IKAKMPPLKSPLQLSVMGCAVNALGEAKHADVAIAFGAGDGLIIKKGEIVGKFRQDELIPIFIDEAIKADEEMQNSL
ncbi:MAG: flavodoxin-dependent (E)-4-hydroxy-3-methylbut-2-enyl-diphosphate synthase, partial [Helicobacter sp.]|nr:flavodoxin-dependent (E)-4-hydroxy-3-methylbut-2-enyl-diphosphate synthase [Helicobacter sp.]